MTLQRRGLPRPRGPLEPTPLTQTTGYHWTLAFQNGLGGGYTKFQFLLCLSPICKSVIFSPPSDATTTNHIGLHSLLYSTHLCLLSAILGDFSGNRNCFYTSSSRSCEPATGCTRPGPARLRAVPWPGGGVLGLGLHQCREVLRAPAEGQEGARADGTPRTSHWPLSQALLLLGG